MNMYKRNKKKTKYYIIGIAVLVILLTVSLLVQGNGNHPNNIIKTISSTINKVVMYPFTALRKQESNECVVEKNVNKELEKEIA